MSEQRDPFKVKHGVTLQSLGLIEFGLLNRSSRHFQSGKTGHSADLRRCQMDR